MSHAEAHPLPGRRAWLVARVLGTFLLGLVGFVTAYLAAVLVAAGLNFGYEFHPEYLAASLPVALFAVAFVFVALRAAGVRSRRLRLGVGCILIAALFVTVILATEIGDRRAREKAERLDSLAISEIAHIPGGRSGSIRTVATPAHIDTFAEGYLNQNDGWVSERTDTVPVGTDADVVVNHYLDQMRRSSWRVRIFRNGGDYELLGRRERALLSVYIEPGTSGVSIWADNDGNRMCASPSDSGCW